MFEVEAKVPISKGEFKHLKKRLKKEAQSLGSRISQDTYYDNPKNVFIRIRKRGGESTLNIKKRQTISGIESNIESEWQIKNAAKWKTLLKRLNILPHVRKTKKSLLFKKNGFIIELNHVRLLGYYLEIERLVKSKKEVPIAKKELIKLFNQLGFSIKQFESRPYLELLANV
ncbi:class IV adenylate cyclase [Candidatus Peregrinibacteria bacterium]|nr:class IV adenylate cyclase [Candidatus Peregrinibacteria bacterium]